MHSDGRITAPINTDDVVAVVGVNSHDVTTQCISPLINMWAKYKPERIGSYGTISLAQRKQNNFGLRPGAVYNSKYSFIQAVKNGTFAPGWTYDRVTAYDWCRLDDFVGYNHRAACPFGEVMSHTGFLYEDTTRSLVVPAAAPLGGEAGGDDLGVLSIADFDSYGESGMVYKDCYFGILLYSSSYQLMATAKNPIGSNHDWQVNFGWVSPSHAGTYRAIPFLSTVPYTTDGAEQSGAVIIGLNSAGADVVLQRYSELCDIFASAEFTSNTSRVVAYEISIANESGTAKTFKNLEILIASNSIGANNTRLISFGQVTVAAGQTWSRSGQVTVSQGFDYFSWFKVGYTGGGTDWEPMPQPEPDIDMPDAG